MDMDVLPQSPTCECNPLNSMLEEGLTLTSQQGMLKKIEVMETPLVGYYVVVLTKWEPTKNRYLTTRRAPYTPRVFKDLKRLSTHLR